MYGLVKNPVGILIVMMAIFVSPETQMQGGRTVLKGLEFGSSALAQSAPSYTVTLKSENSDTGRKALRNTVRKLLGRNRMTALKQKSGIMKMRVSSDEISKLAQAGLVAAVRLDRRTPDVDTVVPMVAWQFEISAADTKNKVKVFQKKVSGNGNWRVRVLRKDKLNMRRPPVRSPTPLPFIVLALNAAGKVVDRVEMPDPRTMYYDYVGKDGKLTGGSNLVKRKAVFTVPLKDLQNIRRIRIEARDSERSNGFKVLGTLRTR